MTEPLINHRSVPLPTAARNAFRAYWESRESSFESPVLKAKARQKSYGPVGPELLRDGIRAVEHCRNIGIDHREPGRAFCSALGGLGPFKSLDSPQRLAFAAAEKEALR